MVLGLRDNYKASASYKYVYRKGSFDNWDIAIDALVDWKVLTQEAEVQFRRMSKMRNEAIHFNVETERNTRADALEALLTFGKVVDAQFAAFNQLPWLFMLPGEVYIKREWEQNPFIRLVYLPNALYVRPRHQVISVFPWKIADTEEYDSREISDEEFGRLRAAMRVV